MLDLILTIVFSGLLVILLRAASARGADMLGVVAVNYGVAASLGWVLTPRGFPELAPVQAWHGLALFQGGLFVLIFFSIGRGTRLLGLGFTGMVIKLSVVFPVLVSWAAYGEALGLRQGFGLLLAMLGIVLLNFSNLNIRRPSQLLRRLRGGLTAAPPTPAGQSPSPRAVGSEPETSEPKTSQPKTSEPETWKRLGLTLFLFLATGLADSNFKIFGNEFGAQVSQQKFVLTLFAVAACVGLGALGVRRFVLGQRLPLGGKELLWGLLVGLPNWYSLVFLLRGLGNVPGSVFFPLNNIGQLLLVNLAGIVLFAERLSVPARWGLAASVAAIALLA